MRVTGKVVVPATEAPSRTDQRSSPVWGVVRRVGLGQDGTGRPACRAFPRQAPSLSGDDDVAGLGCGRPPCVPPGTHSALRMVKDIEVTGEAGGGTEAADGPSPATPTSCSWTCRCPISTASRRCGKIHLTKPDLPVVFLTAHADPGVEKEAREAGASGFLAKGTRSRTSSSCFTRPRRARPSLSRPCRRLRPQALHELPNTRSSSMIAQSCRGDDHEHACRRVTHGATIQT